MSFRIHFLKNSDINFPTLFISSSENNLDEIGKLILHNSPKRKNIALSSSFNSYQFNNFGNFFVFHSFNSELVEEDFENIFFDDSVLKKYLRLNVYCSKFIAKNIQSGKFKQFNLRREND